jgi:hypothetical protein
LFAAILYKRNTGADVYTFADNCTMKNVNPLDSMATIANSFRFSSGGTNFNSIFPTLKKSYERVIILSDMQGWVGNSTPMGTFNEYKKKYNVDTKIYSFDLNGYGSLQFPERNVYALAGFSDKIFDIMKLCEVDKDALINKINSVIL